MERSEPSETPAGKQAGDVQEKSREMGELMVSRLAALRIRVMEVSKGYDMTEVFRGLKSRFGGKRAGDKHG